MSSELSVFALRPLPGSFEQVVVSTTALGLTPAQYTNIAGSERGRGRSAHRALISVETQPIRWTVDGTTPTAAIGHPALAGTIIELEGHDAIRAFRAIRSAGADAGLSVTYFGH